MPGNMNLGTGNSHPHASQSGQSRAEAHGICEVPALDHDDDEEIASEKINWGKKWRLQKRQQMWKIGKEQKSGKLFDKLIGS